jgi:NADH-quinone oxidoreductase subunit F
MERPLTQHIRPGEPPLDLAAYRRVGGYRAVEATVGQMAPTEFNELVKRSGLRGRGGAGFPTGLKWSFVPRGDAAPRPRYFVANADEMEPGAFKDRYLLEGHPHQLVEAMILGAYAIGAEVGYIFLRWEYRLAYARLSRAIAEAREAGFLGDDVCGTGHAIDLHIHVSAGRYMCGEETALLNALEGKRATPRHKPPFPQASGLWGKPTVVNNVETICALPHIALRGADWFRGLGRTGEAGTKLYAASGKLRRPGVWELPIGTPLGEIVDDHAGGMQDGHRFRGVLPGGASTEFLTREHWDLPLDYDAVAAAGSRLGTGTLIVLDDQTCPVGMVHNLERFFAMESCGFCTPCREGLPWAARVLGALEIGEGRPEDLELLRTQAMLLGPGNTFCALAPGASAPLASALTRFAEDFERHVQERRCPYGAASRGVP